jgi:Fe-S cluster biogenesis protein NfuA
MHPGSDLEGDDPETGGLEQRIEQFLLRNFPQIQLHGGDAVIESLDEDTGEVWLRLTGACSGCGISPMTVQALKSRMVAQFDELTAVHAETGMGSSEAGGPDRDFEDVPF